jgi:hypothetical protein
VLTEPTRHNILEILKGAGIMLGAVTSVAAFILTVVGVLFNQPWAYWASFGWLLVGSLLLGYVRADINGRLK